MGNSKITTAGKSERMGGVYKYTCLKEEHVDIENFVEKEFRLRPRGRQGKEFGMTRYEFLSSTDTAILIQLAK